MLRPFRFEGLRTATLRGATELRDGAGGSPGSSTCDVALCVDLAGASVASLAELVVRAARDLASSGVLLLAVPNRFGLRFWSGSPEPGTGQLFTPLIGAGSESPGRAVSMFEVESALGAADLRILERFYPTGARAGDASSGSLLSESFLLAAPAVAASILTGSPSADPERPRLDLFSEVLVGRTLALSGRLADFANYFLVAASRDPASPIWTQLRPPTAEIGWHFSSERRDPVATIFERAAPQPTLSSEHPAISLAETITVRKERGPSASKAPDVFSWTGRDRTELATGELLRDRLHAHLALGRAESFFRELLEFAAFIRERFGLDEGAGDDTLDGSALDAIHSNATRDDAGTFHLFDLEWRAPAPVALSWWILRNVVGCLEMRGQPVPGAQTGAALYATLCRKLGVVANLEADLAREVEFAASVRTTDAGSVSMSTVAALAAPWPVASLQATASLSLAETVSAAAAHQSLVATYNRIETWSAEVQRQNELLLARQSELEEAYGAALREYRELETWAKDIEVRLLRLDEASQVSQRAVGSGAPDIASDNRNPIDPGDPIDPIDPNEPNDAVDPSRPVPRVRVVVVHHRHAELLDYCLRAVLASTGVEVDVVLFENECREPLPEWISGEPRIRRTGSPTTLGFGEANNRAIAWGERQLGPVDNYFFLNNDAVVRPDALARLVEVLEEHPDAAACGPQILIWGAEDHLNSLGLNLSVIGEAWDEGIGLRVDSRDRLPRREEVLALTGSAVLVRRSAFDEAGRWSRLFDFYMEDLDLCLRFRRHRQSIWLVPDAIVAHAVSATAGVDSNFKNFLFLRNRWILMLLHWPWRELRWLVPQTLRSERSIYRSRRRTGDDASADLQRRAWRGALARLPRILWARLGHGSHLTWWKLLKPAGSAPVITLPEVVSRGRPWESAIAGGVPR
ncbi:MAG: glycosyltransferase family 2 protein [Thermoanaerobaculia bacterium]